MRWETILKTLETSFMRGPKSEGNKFGDTLPKPWSVLALQISMVALYLAAVKTLTKKPDPFGTTQDEYS